MNGHVRAALAAFAAIATSLALAATASAQPNSLSVTSYATGFAVSSQGVGPVGIALDSQSRLFVLDSADGWLYRFDPPGGVASPSTRIGTAPLSANPGGLAFDDRGHLYAARYGEGDIVQVDPNTGATLRTVAHLPCALGIAYDAVSDSIFASSCAPRISRISNVQAGGSAVSTYATLAHDADGIAVAPDGTVYAVEGGGAVDRIDGLAASNPGHVTKLATVIRSDGISIGRDFLLLNRTNGIITRLPLNGGAAQDLVTGGTRGDFSAVGPDGCLYATQTNRVVLVTDLDGSCTNLGGPGGLASTTPATAVKGNDLPAAQGCIDRRRFVFHLHHGPGTTVVRVNVFVNGKRRVHARGKDIKTVTLKRLPQKKFRVRVVSVHSNGSTLISTRTYRGCKKSRPHTRRHSHR